MAQTKHLRVTNTRAEVTLTIRLYITFLFFNHLKLTNASTQGNAETALRENCNKQMMPKRSSFNGVPLSFFYINTAELILLQETGQGVIMFSVTE